MKGNDRVAGANGQESGETMANHGAGGDPREENRGPQIHLARTLVDVETDFSISFQFQLSVFSVSTFSVSRIEIDFKNFYFSFSEIDLISFS